MFLDVSVRGRGRVDLPRSVSAGRKTAKRSKEDHRKVAVV